MSFRGFEFTVCHCPWLKQFIIQIKQLLWVQMSVSQQFTVVQAHSMTQSNFGYEHTEKRMFSKNQQCRKKYWFSYEKQASIHWLFIQCNLVDFDFKISTPLINIQKKFSVCYNECVKLQNVMDSDFSKSQDKINLIVWSYNKRNPPN